MSLARKLKRGRAKIVFLQGLKKFMIYRLSNRGVYILENSNSAPHLGKRQMSALIENNKNG